MPLPAASAVAFLHIAHVFLKAGLGACVDDHCFREKLLRPHNTGTKSCRKGAEEKHPVSARRLMSTAKVPATEPHSRCRHISALTRRRCADAGSRCRAGRRKPQIVACGLFTPRKIFHDASLLQSPPVRPAQKTCWHDFEVGIDLTTAKSLVVRGLHLLARMTSLPFPPARCSSAGKQRPARNMNTMHVGYNYHL